MDLTDVIWRYLDLRDRSGPLSAITKAANLTRLAVRYRFEVDDEKLGAILFQDINRYSGNMWLDTLLKIQKQASSLLGAVVVALELFLRRNEVVENQNGTFRPPSPITKRAGGAFNETAVIRELIEQRVKPNAFCAQGFSLLACAVSSNLAGASLLGPWSGTTKDESQWMRIFRAAQEEEIHGAGESRIALVKILLTLGGDSNFRSRSYSLLELAISAGHTHVVKLLLDRGADITEGPQGLTPLRYAIKVGQVHIVKLLLDYGCRYHRRSSRSNAAGFFGARGQHPRHQNSP